MERVCLLTAMQEEAGELKEREGEKIDREIVRKWESRAS